MLISQLPHHLRIRAERERERQIELKIIRVSIRCDNLSFAFIWEESPQGSNYWESIDNGEIPEQLQYA